MATNTIIKTSSKLFKCGMVALSLAGLGLLSSCSDEGSSGGGSSKTEAKITGKVSSNNGPVPDGKLEVKDSAGKVVLNTSVTNGQYKISVPAGTTYPILLTVTPPPDACYPEPVKAVVSSEIADEIDITGVTTDVVDGAIALGGITEQNIARASGLAINRRQKEGVSAGAGGSGGGPGNSGGGAGAGGHAGHNMDDMRKGQVEVEQSAGPCVKK